MGLYQATWMITSVVINYKRHSRNTRYAKFNAICPRYKRETEGGPTFAVSASRLWNNVPLSSRKYRILHGKCVRTVFTSERSERGRFLIQNNECVHTVQSTFHVVLCLLYTYWDWTPSLNYDKLYSNKCGQKTITERKQLRKKRKSSNKIQNLLQDFRRTLLPKNRG